MTNIELIYEKTNTINLCVYRTFLLLVPLAAALLLILSGSWSIYLIKLFIGKRNLFKKTKHCNEMSEREWDYSRLSHETLQAKRLLMLGICATECSWVMFAGFLAGTAIFYDDYGDIPFSYENDHSIVRLRDESTNIMLRFGFSGFYSFFILLLGQVRILTEYMVNRYSRFKSEISLKKRFSILFLQFMLVFVTGMVKATLIFTPLIFLSIAYYQYLRIILSTRALAKWLRTRHFDAKYHEYMRERDVSCYKQIYWEFKIASGLVLTTLFFHIFASTLTTCFPIIQMLITYPDWLHKQYPFVPGHIHYILKLYGPEFGVLLNFVNIIYESSLILGVLFHLLPYLLVTGRLVLKNTLARLLQYRKGVYYDRAKIERLLKTNNRAYRNQWYYSS